ncbi:MAG: hypothetical protein D6683_08105 [Actinomyces sp.]|nr:MAG: hypothetical protein D6683_08105 [Actinomyces sp.]
MLIACPDGPTARPLVGPAPPLASLTGRRLGLLDNRKPNAGVVLTRLAAGLAERTGCTLAVTATKNAALPAPDEVLGLFPDEVDAVLTGAAD